MGDTPAVRAKRLDVRRGNRLALDRCDIALPASATTALVGPNGSGKSTLLSAIAGLLPPAAGTLHVLGHPAGEPAIAARVAYVLQTTAANEALPITVREVVTMARYATAGLLRRLTAADREAVDEAMDILDVANLAHRHLRELSGGQRQRVLVAQGLAQQGDLLLLDEPVTGLDMPSREHILEVIDLVRTRGGTVVMATHDLSDAERADHVVLLDGTVIASGDPDEVITADNLRAAYGGRHGPRHDRDLHTDEHIHSHTTARPLRRSRR